MSQKAPRNRNAPHKKTSPMVPTCRIHTALCAWGQDQEMSISAASHESTEYQICLNIKHIRFGMFTKLQSFDSCSKFAMLGFQTLFSIAGNSKIFALQMMSAVLRLAVSLDWSRLRIVCCSSDRRLELLGTDEHHQPDNRRSIVSRIVLICAHSC